MRSKCQDIRPSPVDADAAIAYAQELIEATFENMKTPSCQMINQG